LENKSLFQALWRQAVAAQAGYKMIWSLGFRGQGDYPFWLDDPSFDTDEKRAELIQEIILEQIEIISEQVAEPVCSVNLYGEIAELYQKGLLNLPSQVIKIWADSGYGKMVSRRQNNDNPRVSAIARASDTGPHGIYYHVTFYDLQASNHLTMLPNTCEFVNKELTKAFGHEMTEYLIVNCGNVRPHIYYLNLISSLWTKKKIDILTYETAYFQKYFPSQFQEVSVFYQEFQKAIIQYGSHQDERGGEQLYFYSIRNIIYAWINHKNCAEELFWLTGEKSLLEQIKWLSENIITALPKWEKLAEKAANFYQHYQNLSEANRFWNQFLLQVKIHTGGLKALDKITAAFLDNQETDYFKAFLFIGEAVETLQKLVDDLNISTSEKWQNFYVNDCLTNISMARDIVIALWSYLRIKGDGPNYYSWEKEYMMSKDESSVVLLTNKTKQLTNEQLYLNWQHNKKDLS
jgi:hypothetical protein